MGFLATLGAKLVQVGKAVLPVVGAAFLGEAAVSALLPDPDDSPKKQAAATGVSALAAPVTAVPSKAGAATLAAIQAGAPLTPGMGRNIVITTIDSFDAQGNRVATEQRRGRPFLMNEDFVTAKRVIKALRKASARIPKQTIRPSKTKMLTDAVIDDAMRRATCPPKGSPSC